MPQYTTGIWALITIVPLFWLIARYLVVSPRPVLARFKKKSTWKLAEIPWLVLGAASIILAQQSLMEKDSDLWARSWRSNYVAAKHEFDEAYSIIAHPEQAQSFGSRGADPIGCSHRRFDGIDLANAAQGDKGFSLCDWFAATEFSLGELAQFFSIDNSRPVPVAVKGYSGWIEDAPVLFGLIVFAHPFASRDRKLIESAIEADTRFNCDRYGKLTYSPFGDIDSVLARGLESACDAAVIWMSYVKAMPEQRTLSPTVVKLWPFLLALGFGFRVARTAAEYTLDKKSEGAPVYALSWRMITRRREWLAAPFFIAGLVAVPWPLAVLVALILCLLYGRRAERLARKNEERLDRYFKKKGWLRIVALLAIALGAYAVGFFLQPHLARLFG